MLRGTEGHQRDLVTFPSAVAECAEDKSIFVNIDEDTIKEVFSEHGLLVRTEPVELGDPRVSYTALWVTRGIRG